MNLVWKWVWRWSISEHVSLGLGHHIISVSWHEFVCPCSVHHTGPSPVCGRIHKWGRILVSRFGDQAIRYIINLDGTDIRKGDSKRGQNIKDMLSWWHWPRKSNQTAKYDVRHLHRGQCLCWNHHKRTNMRSELGPCLVNLGGGSCIPLVALWVVGLMAALQSDSNLAAKLGWTSATQKQEVNRSLLKLIRSP